MKSKIGIIGDGNVGSALKRGLERSQYEVRTTGKNPQAVREIGAWGDIVILAVPYWAADAALGDLGSGIDGKPLIDVTNPLGADFQLVVGFTSSAAEEIQRKAPRARVVKAFNTAFAHVMDKGRARDQQISTFIAGDDAQAKGQVLELARAIGFDPVDCGVLQNARWIESLAYLNIQLGYTLKMGKEIGFKLIR